MLSRKLLRNKTICASPRNFHTNDLADRILIVIDNGRQQPWRATNHLTIKAAFLFQKHIHFATDERILKRILLLGKQRLKALQTLILDRLFHMIGKISTGCPGTREYLNE